ncbi:MAG: hypothetical protein LBN22_11610 [Clostridiales Family XIII bacterium]|nr:hypothetical protein [Clostridiales Family XIII bacterium]
MNLKIIIKKPAGIYKALNGINQESKIVLQRTTSDFISRAPAWIARAVASEYNITGKEVKTSIKQTTPQGKMKLGGGKVVENKALLVEGRRLTPRVGPGLSGDGPGKRFSLGTTGKKRTVKATIKKGQRKVIHTIAFIASPKSTQLPFMRTGKSRYPIEAIKTLSVPQMVDNELVRKKIYAEIEKGISARVDNHLKAAEKRINS